MRQNIHIVYFSGTGGTALAAKRLSQTFSKRDIQVQTSEIFRNDYPIIKTEETLILMFPVHAADAPMPVFKWISSISKNSCLKTIVISVSGGGEISPNTAARYRTVKKLTKKGFAVTNEYMLCMPSNFIAPTEDNLAKKIIEILPRKCEKIANDIIGNVKRKMNSNVVDRIIMYICQAEKLGSKIYGRTLKIDDNCNGCELCAKKCPMGNIMMEDNKPTFGWKCTLCMRCVYGCPLSSIRPIMPILKKAVLKQGYDIKKYEELALEQSSDEEINFPRSIIWNGIVKYIKEE